MSWTGSVLERGGVLYLQFKDSRGKWVKRSTELPINAANRLKAEKLLVKVRDRVQAGREVTETGPVTVRAYSERWLERRVQRGVKDVPNDIGRLKHHILPIIGEMKLSEVRPRHILAVVDAVKGSGHAPKTIRNVYSICKSMFREAALGDLIDGSPCILGRTELGRIHDKHREWRQTARFTPEEMAVIIYDPRIPEDRRVVNALLGFGAFRSSEMANLRWRHYDQAREPLGGLVVTTKVRTETGERIMPVHQELARVLAAWKLGGWARQMGRHPEPDDLIVPLPAGPRVALGKKRTKNDTYKRFRDDLRMLGLRHRRVHDMRRTFISIARDLGADKDLLRRATHSAQSSRDVMELYTTEEWNTLCRQVSAVKIPRLSQFVSPLEKAE